jgi:DNA-binding NarL/FixJ family response regulator
VSTPTVVLVDDHPVFRHGLAALLTEEGIDVIGSAATSVEGLALIERLEPQIVLLDLHLPDRSGVETCRRIMTALPRTRVLVLTMDSADATLIAALRAGARGYLLKEAAADEIAPAIRTVLNGDLVIDARLAARLPALLTHEPAPTGALAALTPRERSIVALVVEGCSNAEIGRRLFLAEKTVRNNLTAVLAKTGAADRGALRALIAEPAPAPPPE